MTTEAEGRRELTQHGVLSSFLAKGDWLAYPASVILYCAERGWPMRPNPKKNMVYGTPMPELTITSPYVHSRVDSNTFTMANPMPESTFSPSQRLWIWPLLTVETEANGDSRSTNERCPFLVGSLGSSCRYKRFSSCLGCSSRPSTKYFFLTPYTILLPLCL